MNLEGIFYTERKQRSTFMRRNFTALLFSGLVLILYYAFQYIVILCAGFFTELFPATVRGYLLFQMLLYACPILLAALCGKLMFLHLYKVYPAEKRACGLPRKPLLYIFGSVGVGYIVSLTINILFGDLLERFDTGSGIPAGAESDPVAIVLSYVYIAVLPAILEELLFRGTILKALLPYGRRGALIISALLFGALHIDPGTIVFASVFGYLLGLAYEYTGSIKLTVLIHFLNNVLSVTMTFLGDSEGGSAVLVPLVWGLLILGIIFIVYYSRRGLGAPAVKLGSDCAPKYTLNAAKYCLFAAVNPAILILLCFVGWQISLFLR